MGDKEDIRDVLPEELRLEDNIPEELCYDIVEQARGNEHYSCVYRVAKWGDVYKRQVLYYAKVHRILSCCSII